MPDEHPNGVGSDVARAQPSQPNADGWLAEWSQKLDSLVGLQAGWNGYVAPPPTVLAINTARSFLQALHRQDYAPTRLAASAVGGIGITRRRGERKVYIEFYNDGRVYALFSDGSSEPNVRPIPPESSAFHRLVLEMKDYLDE